MPNSSLDDLIGQDLQSRGTSNVAGVSDVSPQHAVTGLDTQALTGLPATAGMRSPEDAQTQALGAQQQAAMASSPAVGTWAATAHPAHLAVTQDDFPSLAKIAQWFRTDSNFPQPIQDILHVGDLLQKGISQSANEYIQTLGQHPLFSLNPKDYAPDVKQLGAGLSTLFGAASIPFAVATAPLTEPAARALAPHLTQSLPLLPWEQPHALTTPDAQLNEARNLVNVAVTAGTLGAGLRGLFSGAAKGATGEGLPPEGGTGDGSGPEGGGPLNPSILAAHDAEQVAKVQEEVAASQTHARSPSTMQTFLDQQTTHTVAVDPDKVLELQQQGHDIFPDHREEVIQSARAGEPFEVPLSTYLTETGGQPFAEELNKATVFRNGGQSVEEGEGAPTQSTFIATPIAEGYDVHNFEYVAPNGEKVTGVITPPKEPGGALEVDINGESNTPGDRSSGVGRLGIAGVRDLYRKIVAQYPDASSIQGLRTTGARGTPAEASVQINKEATLPTDITPTEAPRARYLAAESESAVERVVADQRLRELFTDPKALGMSKDQFARYNEGVESAIADAKERMLARAYTSIRAERLEPFKAAVAQHTPAVEQELAQLPAIRARAELATGKGPLGEPLDHPLKLATDDQLSQHARDLGLPARMFSKSGVSPDEAAELLGYPSGADMIRDLVDLQSLQGDRTITQHTKDMVREVATERARRELGYSADREALHEAASEAVTAPSITNFLADHLAAFAKEHNLPFDKDTVKQEALDRFNQRPVKEATNIRKLETFLRKDGLKVEKALLKGDVGAAFRWKQVQLRHQIELAAAHKFLKVERKFERLAGKVARKVSMKSVSPDALNWSKSILATTGRPVKANPRDLEALHTGGRELRDYVDEKNSSGADIPYTAPRPLPLRDQSVAQYTSTANMVTAIMHWGREENTVRVGAERRDLLEQVHAGVDSLNRYTRTISDEEIAHPDLLQRADAVRRAVDSWLVRQEQLMRDFGARDPNSPFFLVVSRRIQERKTWNNDKRVEIARHFHAVAKSVGPKFDRWLDTRLPKGISDEVRTADGSRLFVKNRDIMMAALHLGDEGALTAFEQAYNIQPGVLESIVHAYATPEMWKAVRGIWDVFEQLGPQAAALYKRTTGVTPELVEPRAFKMPDGSTNRGGYFPIRRDMNALPSAYVKSVEAGERMLGSPRYARAAPNNGYIKARTGAVGPMDMNFQSIYTRINQTIHDLAFREALADVNKFLLHPEMVDAINHKYGPEYVSKIRQDLRDIAGGETEGRTEAKIGGALDYLTEGQMVNMIGYSPKTMMKHGLTALFQASTEVGLPRYGASWRRLMIHPMELTHQAMTESGDIRHILSTYNEDAFRQYMSLSGKRTTLDHAIRSFAFHMVGTSNWLTAVPLYDAAKGMYRDKFPSMGEPEVQAAAGQLVRQALGSSGRIDAPIALRIGGGRTLAGRLFRLTNPFLTFLNHMYNKQREIPQAFGYAGEKADIGRGLAIMVATIVIPTYIEQAVTRGEFNVLKKGVNQLEYWGSGLVHNEFGGTPVLNTAVAAGMHKLDPEYPQGDDALTSIFGSMGQTAKDLNDTFVKHHPWTEKKTERATIAAGYATRKPGVALMRVEHFLYELSHTPETAFHDLFFGKGHKK